MHRMRRYAVLMGLTLAIGAVPARRASADLIRPNAPRAYPDVAAIAINGNIHYAYDSATQTGEFQVANVPYQIAGGPTPADEFNVNPDASGVRAQVFKVALDANGHILANDPGNVYEMYGTITANGHTYSGLLLKGTPTNFGSLNVNQGGLHASFFDADLKITGGQLAANFGPDAYIRLMPELDNAFDGSFNKNFTVGKTSSNTRAYHAPYPFPIPEPATLALLLAGGLGLVVHRCRKAGR